MRFSSFVHAVIVGGRQLQCWIATAPLSALLRSKMMALLLAYEHQFAQAKGFCFDFLTFGISGEEGWMVVRPDGKSHCLFRFDCLARTVSTMSTSFLTCSADGRPFRIGAQCVGSRLHKEPSIGRSHLPWEKRCKKPSTPNYACLVLV